MTKRRTSTPSAAYHPACRRSIPTSRYAMLSAPPAGGDDSYGHILFRTQPRRVRCRDFGADVLSVRTAGRRTASPALSKRADTGVLILVRSSFCVTIIAYIAPLVNLLFFGKRKVSKRNPSICRFLPPFAISASCSGKRKVSKRNLTICRFLPPFAISASCSGKRKVSKRNLTMCRFCALLLFPLPAPRYTHAGQAGRRDRLYRRLPRGAGSVTARADGAVFI